MCMHVEAIHAALTCLHILPYFLFQARAFIALAVCTGEKKDKKEKKQARKAARSKGGNAGERNAAADRLPTPEELAAAGARLGPRAEAERRTREEAAAAASAEAPGTEEAVESSSSDDEEADEAELHQQLQVWAPCSFQTWSTNGVAQKLNVDTPCFTTPN